MKTSVIFAILQMSIGIFLKGMNSLYFRRKLDFFFEFIPQIILILVLFGWMDLLIIGKWNMKKNVNIIWDENSSNYTNIHKSPAIITTMIDIFLNVGSNEGSDGKAKYLYVFGETQKSVSVIFLLIAFICVPVMLLVKPLILKRELDHHHNVEVQHD